MQARKRNIVEWAMHYRQIVILVTCCMIALGIYGLKDMRKNEFPDFTIRQGIVIAAYPGASSSDIEAQVTEPLEDYIFSYKEVKKSKTQSLSKDGMSVIQVQLNDDLEDKDLFWSKFKHGINQFKSQLPKGVLAVLVLDDFGDTSALLVSMESSDKTYRELDSYMDELKKKLRPIESIGRMSVHGMRQEQISIYLDNNKLSHYGINDKTLAATLFGKGFTTTAGRVKNQDMISPVYVGKSMNSLYEICETIVYSDPLGNVVRLKDIAKVEKEYPSPSSYITNNGKKCLLLSIEMKKGKNIVQMGEEVKNVLDEYEKTLPDDVEMYKITDQSKVVDDSVTNFLKELVIAIMAVILVVMLLLPFKVALVAASTIPISIFISLGLFYVAGIELNTVTLAALIVTLGMIVDNSIVIIDSYMEKLAEGMSRWHASIESATHFFKSIFSATLAISITFFPFLFTLNGMYKDFIHDFPWAVTMILMISLLVAVLLVPFMQFFFLKTPVARSKNKGFNFLDICQKGYNRILDLCFAYPKSILSIGVFVTIIGGIMLYNSPEKLLPVAERNQFAVEIYMPEGTAVEKTAFIADSLEHILRKDSRVVSITSFKGASSPRFHTAYAPQLGGSNFAQFIVNTVNDEATEELLDEYTPVYESYFPSAFVRFKQIGYSDVANPIEIRLQGEDSDLLKHEAKRIEKRLRDEADITLVRSSLDNSQPCLQIDLNKDASRMGISNLMVEATMAMRYSNGIPVATVWEGNYDIPVVLKGSNADSVAFEDIHNELIPAYMGIKNVPLRQISDITPIWKEGEIMHRNGIHTVSVTAEVMRGMNEIAITKRIIDIINDMDLSDRISISYGGALEESQEQMPRILKGLCISICIIFLILLGHFKRISTALLVLCSLTLCLFGTSVGMYIHNISFSVTCVLGIVSLMGILVRNGIIMIDYAEELRKLEHMSARDSIYHSARRRMRPIALTSFAASMGVIPMIIGGSGLWMPMGTVIFYGTLITMIFILTFLPVCYWKVMSGTTKKRLKKRIMETN